MHKAILIAAALAVSPLHAADPPQAEISNGVIHAKLYLPDAANGYYRATRFDWSGVVASLEFQGHNYFGVWFPHYDPKLHDAITGPVEEYRTGESGLGYDEAKVGGTFVRIGVGLLKKPQEERFGSSKPTKSSTTANGPPRYRRTRWNSRTYSPTRHPATPTFIRRPCGSPRTSLA
jgi:hypothetical protein